MLELTYLLQLIMPSLFINNLKRTVGISTVFLFESFFVLYKTENELSEISNHVKVTLLTINNKKGGGWYDLYVYNIDIITCNSRDIFLKRYDVIWKIKLNNKGGKVWIIYM